MKGWPWSGWDGCWPRYSGPSRSTFPGPPRASWTPISRRCRVSRRRAPPSSPISRCCPEGCCSGEASRTGWAGWESSCCSWPFCPTCVLGASSCTARRCQGRRPRPCAHGSARRHRCSGGSMWASRRSRSCFSTCRGCRSTNPCATPSARWRREASPPAMPASGITTVRVSMPRSPCSWWRQAPTSGSTSMCCAGAGGHCCGTWNGAPTSGSWRLWWRL